jgi:hypothetical protein
MECAIECNVRGAEDVVHEICLWGQLGIQFLYNNQVIARRSIYDERTFTASGLTTSPCAILDTHADTSFCSLSVFPYDPSSP